MAKCKEQNNAVTIEVVNALVPLSEMFGYVGDLRTMSSGRANYTMQFDSYQQMPASVQEEVVLAYVGSDLVGIVIK